MKKELDLIAVVIAIDHYNALGVIRSLGESGIPVALVLTSLEKTYVEKSRYVSEVYRIKQNEEQLKDVLLRISAKHNSCYIITTTDFSALALDNIISQLPKNVIGPSMNGKMKEYQNKAYAKKMASQEKIRIPKGIIYRFEDETIEWSFFPAIIKPLASVNGLKSDIRRADNMTQLIEILDQFHAKGYTEVLVEQFIQGENAHMVEVMGFSDGCTVSFGKIVKKIREYPINNGSTAFAEFVSKLEDLDLHKLEKFILNSEYKGIFDIEFKLADNKCYFIECNFRNGAPSYALTQIGFNCPSLWIGQMGKMRINCKSKRNKRRFFMCEQTDFINVLKRNVGIIKWIGEYFRSNKVFICWNDIKPNFFYFLFMLRIAFNKILNRLSRRRRDA